LVLACSVARGKEIVIQVPDTPGTHDVAVTVAGNGTVSARSMPVHVIGNGPTTQQRRRARDKKDAVAAQRGNRRGSGMARGHTQARY